MVEKTNKLIQEFLENKLDKKMGITWWNEKRLDHIKELIKNLERVKKELDAEGLKKLDVDGLETFLKSISDAYKGNDKLNEWLKSLEPLKTVEEIDKRIDSIVEFLQYHNQAVPKAEIRIEERVKLAKLINEKAGKIALNLDDAMPELFKYVDHIRFQIYFERVISTIISFNIRKREDFEEIKAIVKKKWKDITKEDSSKVMTLGIGKITMCEIGGTVINLLSQFGAKVKEAKGRHIGGALFAGTFSTGFGREKLVNLTNWDKFFGKRFQRFDVTTSVSVLEDGSGVAGTLTEKERGMVRAYNLDYDDMAINHLLCVFSNLTKAGGLSIQHVKSGHDYVLPGTPLKLVNKIDFGGFGDHKYTLVYQKTSNKDVSYEEYISMIKEYYKEIIERAA